MVDKPDLEPKAEDTESKEDDTEDIINILQECKPDWNPDCKPIDCKCGSDFVEESFFVFKDTGYFWITKLCTKRGFAFKKITADWVRFYANLILLSPVIFVEFDKKHRIIGWRVIQPKKCPCKKDFDRDKDFWPGKNFGPGRDYNPVLPI